MITGKMKTIEQNQQENTMFVMTHSSTQILPEIQHFTKTDDSLLTPPNIEEFWKLETIGVAPEEDNLKLLWITSKDQ